MLKSFIISFLISLTLIFLLFGCKVNNEKLEVAQEIKEQKQVEEVFPLKKSETCNNVEAVADIMFGEGENQTLDAKYSLAYFLISQSIQNNRTLCEELKYRMPGGALKYSSMYNNLKKLKKQRATSYANILKQAEEFWNNKEYLNYNKMDKYNHYITVSLAKHNPPKWFKYYIVDYKVSGDHVFVNLDFKDKESRKYAANYQKMVSTFN